MKKHFLVTLSNDSNYLFGVRFLCSFFRATHNHEHQVTLLHICSRDGNNMSQSLMEMWQDPGDEAEAHLSAGARKSISRAKRLLSDHSMSIDHIITKTFVERYGKVKDILTEGARGLYDAIVLGRRASYALQWMFERPGDETAQAVIRDSGCSTPLWICPEPETDRKNVLLCLDGSDNALRAVDHVGYILADQPQQHITLLHVTGGSRDSATIFRQAEDVLQRHAISNDRISKHTTRGLTIAGAILSEIDKDKYAVVALGLRGERTGKGLPIAGGTTAKLISKIEKVSLWCCP